ncbi:hypothetical protein Pla52nx_006339 [Stieleria varia]
MTLVLIGIVGAGVLYWAHRQTQQVPDFYAEAIERMPVETAEASSELTANVEELQSQAAKSGSWRAKFSDEQINAWLLEELPRKFPILLTRGVSDPRILIRDDHMLVAAKYQNRKIDTVVSFQVSVKLTEHANLLAVQISNLRAGALPLPMQRFLDNITNEAAKGDVDVKWDLTDEGPVALISVPRDHPKYVVSPVVVESVQMTDGILSVAGHTGPKAEASFQPQGRVHRFVSIAEHELLGLTMLPGATMLVLDQSGDDSESSSHNNSHSDSASDAVRSASRTSSDRSGTLR